MRWVVAFLLVISAPVTTLADGKFFPPTALPANVTIPDQRALIHFTNGVERLVIETRFTGAGTNFAWVIPLPSQPVIEEATTGLFPTLQYLFRPQIRHNIPRYYPWIFGLLWLGYLLATVRPTGRMTWLDLGLCLLVVVGLDISFLTSHHQGGLEWRALATMNLLIFVDLVCIVMLVRFWKRLGVFTKGVLILFTKGVLILLAVQLLAAMLLPSKREDATPSMASTTSAGTVSVLDRKLVGIFETATIASHDPKALQTWLRDNGFAVPTNAEPVIESYVKDGWVFVAVKVQRNDPKLDTSTPHPLSFTFKTDKPVYPMRLTGVDNGPLNIELYVFGPARAEAKYFRVRRCHRPDYPEMPVASSVWRDQLPDKPIIVHPLLRNWVDGAPVATKLTAMLTPAQMQQDVWLRWSPFKEKEQQLYSRTGALTTGLNWGASLAAVGMLGIGLVQFVSGKSVSKRFPTVTGASLLTGAILAGVVYFALPKTEVRTVKFPTSLARQVLHELYVELHGASPNSLAEARAAARQILEQPNDAVSFVNFVKRHGGTGWDNFIMGGLLREEDSPGNFTLRDNGGVVEFVRYDALGAEHVMGGWPLSKSD